MPTDRLPSRGGLPVSPMDLRLKAGRSVTVEAEPISFTLLLDRSTSSDGHVERPASLDWTFLLTLTPVNRLGHPSGTPDRRRWQVRRLRSPERSFGMLADPGLFRASVTIRKIRGRTLASYRQFINVLPARDRISIGLRGGDVYRPGETVLARVENRGTHEAVLPEGSALVVERLDGGSWVNAEASGEAPSVMFEDREFLPAGRASGCSYFMIPSDPVSTSVPIQPRRAGGVGRD